LILVVLLSATAINYFIYPKTAFLNFYYLPVMVAGYFLGKRMAVLIAFFAILMVWVFVLINKEGFFHGGGQFEENLNLMVWGGFLILSGWLGSLSEKLNMELQHSNKLREDLAQEREMLRKAFNQLHEHSEKLEEKVAERTAELEKSRRELEISAVTDPLTNLLNRRGMEDKLHYEELRFNRDKKAFSLIMGDIDHFKKINDEYGHDAGDHVLVQVAKILMEIPRKQDVICRWGGEEFLALLPETELKGGSILAEKLRKKIEEEKIHFNGADISVAMSFGVSTFEADQTLEECIRKADECLYQAKDQGRNRTIPPP